MHPHRRVLLLVAGFLVLHSLGNWSLPIVDRDEPRFAEASREMRERRDYLIPHFNDEERFDKPPLIYWLQAGAFAILGENEFAARLPAVLASALTSALIALWGARLFDARTGLCAGVIFGLCLQLFVHGRAAVADMPMVLAVTAAAWSGWEWLHGPRERRLITGMLFWVSMAIGFLAKGPIALVPIAMVAIAARRVPGQRPAAVAWIGGALLMLVVIGAWGVPALLGTGGEFARVGLGKHVVARSFSPLEGHGAVGLVGYLATLPMYFVTVFGSLFPWSIWLVPAARFYRNRERLGDRERYLLAGCGIVFAIFTVSRTKLPHYTLPAFPFLALLLASWWSRHRSVVTFARLATLTAMGFAVTALVAFPILAGYFPSDALFARAAPFIPADAQFAAVGYQEPSLVWVFRKKTSGFMTEMKPQQAAAFMSRPGPRFCVIREQDLASAFQGFDPSWLVFRARGYQVAKGRRVTVLLILKLDQVSSTNVTGPSLTSSTSIISPKTPVSM